MSELQQLRCQSCQKALTSKRECYGSMDETLCYDCWSSIIEPEIAPISDCPECGQHALYEKGEAGYPGLFHCAGCGVWIDKIHGSTWKNIFHNKPLDESPMA